jgi:hypothetical protein
MEAEVLVVAEAVVAAMEAVASGVEETVAASEVGSGWVVPMVEGEGAADDVLEPAVDAKVWAVMEEAIAAPVLAGQVALEAMVEVGEVAVGREVVAAVAAAKVEVEPAEEEWEEEAWAWVEVVEVSLATEAATSAAEELATATVEVGDVADSQVVCSEAQWAAAG